MSYLQGGTRRRRSRPRVPLALVALLALTALGVALWPARGGHERRVARRSAAIGPDVASATPRTPAGPLAYGRLPADPVHRVRIAFSKPPRAALLWDVRSGRVLYARHARRALPIASLTKMMTALVVTDRARAGDGVRISSRAVRAEGSRVGNLPRGRKVRLETLLYGLLLASGNDAAIALAEHVGTTVPGFVRLMNRRARALRLPCTRFSTPSGFRNQGNAACASDLAVIAGAVLHRPLLARIVRSRSAILPFPTIRGRKLYLFNHNPLLRLRYPGTNGVKTGYTGPAGRCLVATVKRRGRWLGVVLLRSPDPTTQAMRLLAAGFRA